MRYKRSATSRQKTDKGQGKRKSVATFAFIALNIVIIAVMFMTVMNYTKNSLNNVQQRNILSASNATSAVTESVMLYFTNQQRMLNQQKHYIETSEGLSTYDETVAYLTRANNDSFYDYQLLDAETFTGVSISYEKPNEEVIYNATGTFFIELQQAASDSLNDAIDDRFINIIPAFSNPVNGMQSVAFYTDMYLEARDGTPRKFLLLFVTKVDDLLGSGLPTPPYNNAGAAIISANGDYIVKTNTFRSTNIFEYFRGYAEMSYPQLDQMRADIAADAKGYYFLRDHRGEERIYVYNAIGQTHGWTYFSSIPMASMELYTIDYVFVMIVVGFVLLLAVIDALIILRLNIRLKRSLADARRASEAKGSFMSSMSHEIRTPLNAIIGYNNIAYNEMVAIKSGEGNKQSETSVVDCLKKSEIASKHLLTIINDVLDMSAIESGKVEINHEKFNFKGLITSLTTIFYSQARSKGVDFKVVFLTPPDEWFVGDQMRTNQILTNLLSNAIKFTSDGGKVTLSIQRLKSEDAAAHIRFEVSDSGIGMTQESLEHIWVPFEQADSSIARRFGGTGLGLSITKNLVDIMGGAISVESAIGVGTTFTVDLKFDCADNTSASPNAKRSYHFDGARVLLAEDNDMNMEIAKRLMESVGLAVDCAWNGKQAVEMFTASAAGTYSAILMDIQMPELNGLDATRAIRASTHHQAGTIPIIAMTADAFAEKVAEALGAGMNYHLSKPIDLPVFLGVLDKYINIKD